MGKPEPAEPAGGRSHRALSPPAWRCTLGQGVSVRRASGRAFVISERPLVVIEVRPRALRLMARLTPGEPVAIGTLTAPELRFLRRLAGVGLIDMRPIPSAWPSLTVVVPVRDRPVELAGCLESLARVRYPQPLEIVVVDDGSAQPVQMRDGVRLVRLSRSIGPAGARNAGVAACRTELVAFLDSDCAAEPGWLEALAPAFADPEVAAAGGRVLPASERGWLERYEAVRSPLDLGATPAAARPRSPVPYLVTANLVVRRAAFEAAGGFDPAMRWGEDVDLCWRLVASGHRLVYEPSGAVRHHHRGEPGAFIRTRATYAASEADLLRRHPANGRWLGFSAGTGAALVGAVGALLGRPRLLMAGGLALGLEVAATAGTLRSLGVPRRRSAPALVRGQANGLYWVARQLARYYGLPALLVALASGRGRRRPMLLTVAVAEVAPAVVDWWRLRSGLSLPRFVAAQLLDDAAYQVGLLRGCLRQRSAAALSVELRLMGGDTQPEP